MTNSITTPGDTEPAPVTVDTAHQRHNHDDRRYGISSYAGTTDTDTSQESISIPASLIAQEEAQQSQNAESAGTVDVIPHRPLGL